MEPACTREGPSRILSAESSDPSVGNMGNALSLPTIYQGYTKLLLDNR